MNTETLNGKTEYLLHFTHKNTAKFQPRINKKYSIEMGNLDGNTGN